ncbi:MAG: hypothetical protein M1818_002327 [Claussenomyces sp. TS43310]|nr:MAG: hypothetical protein M1818_002327 [Claussenomyces sp. TS43310]
MLLSFRSPFLLSALLTVGSISIIAIAWHSSDDLQSLIKSPWAPVDSETPAATISLAQAEESLSTKIDELAAKEAALAKLAEELAIKETELEAGRSSKVAKPSALEERSLISYVYFDTPDARRNLEFFLQHGFHTAADFIFILNGETHQSEELLPNHPNSPFYNPNAENIRVVLRPNTCFDLGAHAEVLQMTAADVNALQHKNSDPTDAYPGRSTDENGQPVRKPGAKLWEGYTRFILMNASIRGPFMPHWSMLCWSEAFWAKLSKTVKMVGTSYNCHSGKGHVQSMMWALDRTGLELVLQPDPIGISYCPKEMIDAVYGEIRATPAIRDAGYEVDVMTEIYHSKDGLDLDGDGLGDHDSKAYYADCKDGDYLYDKAYHGFNIHPYETIFMKTKRGIDEEQLNHLTEWTDGSGYSSLDLCMPYTPL